MPRKLSIALDALFVAAFSTAAMPAIAQTKDEGKMAPKLAKRPNGHPGKFAPECLCTNDEKARHSIHGCGTGKDHAGTCATATEHAKDHTCGKAKDPAAPVCGPDFVKK